MFVFSCKTTKKQLAWAGVCAGLCIAIMLTVMLPPVQTTATATSPLTVTTAEQGADFLRQRGYEVSGGDVQEIQIPDTLDPTLSAYAELLKQADVDFSQFLGKRVKLRTYTVENHESGAALAHLYIYKDTVVAADITANGVPTVLDIKTKDGSYGTTG